MTDQTKELIKDLVAIIESIIDSPYCQVALDSYEDNVLSDAKKKTGLS